MRHSTTGILGFQGRKAGKLGGQGPQEPRHATARNSVVGRLGRGVFWGWRLISSRIRVETPMVRLDVPAASGRRAAELRYGGGARVIKGLKGRFVVGVFVALLLATGTTASGQTIIHVDAAAVPSGGRHHLGDGVSIPAGRPA